MHDVLIIWRKELYNYFWSPIAYIVLPVFLIISGYFFSFSLFYLQVANMSNALHNMSIMLLLISPVLTMRLVAEERHSGSLDLLYSMPISILSILIGKYLAAWSLLVIMLACSTIFLVPLYMYGEPDFGPIFSGYLGIFLLGSVYLAVGLFVTSLRRNQIVVAIGTTGILIILWFLTYLDNFDVTGLQGIRFSYLSVSVHFSEFVKGTIPISSIIYMASLSWLFLFCSWISLNAKRYHS